MPARLAGSGLVFVGVRSAGAVELIGRGMPVRKVAATRAPSAREEGSCTPFQRLLPATTPSAKPEASAGTVTVLL